MVDSLLEAGVSEGVREVAMSLRQKWQDEGRAEGQAEGERRGRAELVLKLLQLRFGELAADVRARVEAASIEDLDLWAERVLTAAELDAVFT